MSIEVCALLAVTIVIASKMLWAFVEWLTLEAPNWVLKAFCYALITSAITTMIWLVTNK